MTKHTSRSQIDDPFRILWRQKFREDCERLRVHMTYNSKARTSNVEEDFGEKQTPLDEYLDSYRKQDKTLPGMQGFHPIGRDARRVAESGINCSPIPISELLVAMEIDRNIMEKKVKGVYDALACGDRAFQKRDPGCFHELNDGICRVFLNEDGLPNPNLPAERSRIGDIAYTFECPNKYVAIHSFKTATFEHDLTALLHLLSRPRYMDVLEFGKLAFNREVKISARAPDENVGMLERQGFIKEAVVPDYFGPCCDGHFMALYPELRAEEREFLQDKRARMFKEISTATSEKREPWGDPIASLQARGYDLELLSFRKDLPSPKGFSIRPPTRGDTYDILSVANQTCDRRVHEQALNLEGTRTYLSETGILLVRDVEGTAVASVALVDESLPGYAYGVDSRSSKGLVPMNMAVIPSHRNKGVFTDVIKCMVDYLKEFGPDRVVYGSPVYETGAWKAIAHLPGTHLDGIDMNRGVMSVHPGDDYMPFTGFINCVVFHHQ